MTKREAKKAALPVISDRLADLAVDIEQGFMSEYDEKERGKIADAVRRERERIERRCEQLWTNELKSKYP